MPRLRAELATLTPMAPRPMTPSFLPLISGPAKADLPFSTSLPHSSPLPFRELANSMPGMILREVRNRAQRTSSLTALALAPGVLKTTMPSSAQRSTGTLLVPAPALAMARVFGANSVSCILALRTRMASGSAMPVPTVYLAGSSWLSPASEMLLRVRILYMTGWISFYSAV